MLILYIIMKRKHELPHINDIIKDYTVVDIIFRKSKPPLIKLHCNICHREKLVTEQCLQRNIGLTHTSCGKGLKTNCKRFYNMWTSLRARTTNKNCDKYKYYGGRGINSDAFKNFIDFYDSMYDKYKIASKYYGTDTLSIDRIDNDGNYEPNNCRFIPMHLQHGNTSRNKLFKAISPSGQVYYSKNQLEFSRLFNLNADSVHEYLHNKHKKQDYNGWRFEFL